MRKRGGGTFDIYFTHITRSMLVTDVDEYTRRSKGRPKMDGLC